MESLSLEEENIIKDKNSCYTKKRTKLHCN